MKTRRIAAAVLFTFLPATVSLPAWSQQDDAVTIQARARFKEGVEAFDKGKYEEARLSFLQAYALKKHPSVLLNLAQSSAKANHPLDAAKYFQQFLKEATSASPQQRKDAEAGLAEVRQKLGRIDVVAPAGTEISLDDQGKVGTTPMEPIDVEPGSHTVKSPTQSATVIAVVGQKVEARLGMPAAPAAVGPVTAPPPSTEPIGEATAPAPGPTPPEDHGPTKRTNLLVPPKNMTPVYIGLGAAGVAALSAIVFGLFKSDAQSKADTVANQIRTAAAQRNIPTQGVCNSASAPAEFATACKTLVDNNDKVDTNAAIANVSLAVMGAGLVFAGVWYLAAPKRGESTPQTGRAPERPIVTPWAGWNTGGVSVAGQF